MSEISARGLARADEELDGLIAKGNNDPMDLAEFLLEETWQIALRSGVITPEHKPAISCDPQRS